jgi:hypothetical protein
LIAALKPSISPFASLANLLLRVVFLGSLILREDAPLLLIEEEEEAGWTG